MNNMKKIDECFNPSHDEVSRQGYVSLMRKFIMNDISSVMNDDYEKNIKKDFLSLNSRTPSSGEEVRKSIEKSHIYKIWSSLRYNAQEMVWESVREGVEREIPDMISIYKEALNPLESYIKNYPNDKAVLNILFQINRNIGNSSKALEYKKRADAL